MPTRHNAKLRELLVAINADVELQQLWRCANVNAVDRSGLSDHGPVHVQIVANAALRLLRLLGEAGVGPSVVASYSLAAEDAELIVTAASCLHDIGIAISREDHERYSLVLAYGKCRELFRPLYPEPALTIMVCETLHAIAAHRWDMRCLTLEAGVVKVADALDMSEGRSRIPFSAGKINIHSVSAHAVKAVRLEKGSERPVRICVQLADWAGIFQVDELLHRKLEHSTLAPYVEVVVITQEGEEKRLH